MCEISRQELFHVWLNNTKPEKFEAILKFVLTIFGRDVDYEKLKARLRKLCYDFQVRWDKSRRVKPRFMHDNALWLKTTIQAAEFILDVASSTSKKCLNVGRQEKEFSECCVKTKQRKCKELTSNISTDHLIMATELKIRSCGKRDAADLVKELANASPSRGTIIKKARLSVVESKRLSADKALAMIIDANLSTHQYLAIRQHTKHCSPKIYPCYDLVKQSKLLCYPNNITVTETCAEINLQSLIDHTVKRLISAQEDLRDEVCIIINKHC